MGRKGKVNLKEKEGKASAKDVKTLGQRGIFPDLLFWGLIAGI